jgi:hypothetical protein
MSPIPLFLAALDLSAILRPWRLLSPIAREGLLIFGAMASVTLLAMAWALFLRRKRHHRHRHHHHGHHDSSELAEISLAPNEADATAGPEKRRRRRRRSGRHHRPRNPTLAETGGLPPIRPPEPPAPQP